MYDGCDLTEFWAYLLSPEYEDAVLAWKDPGEVLSMRKVDKLIFQYHLRIYVDGQVRGHYEYSSEGNPWRHITEQKFEPASEYFRPLLNNYLKRT